MNEAIKKSSGPVRLRAMRFMVLAVVVSVVACAPAEEAAEEAVDVVTHDETAMAEALEGGPRVFFISPEDGATVTSPVLLEFGAENFGIEPVGEGEIHEGMGHYHIGVNTPCLEPGIVIGTASPWIHFGDGSAEIEMQLEPGTATLCLQIGDGEHRTLGGEGLSSILTLNVVEPEESGADS